jgi:anti-anti-sigma regulatory factor
MGIQFDLKDDIQIVAIDGKLSAVEEAAIRLKLDQKIGQGRTTILFALAGLDLQDAQTLKNIQQLLVFSLNREALCAVFGIKKSNFKLLTLSGSRDIEKFETESEAKSWFEKIKAERAAPKVEQKDTGKDPELEIKAKELAALLKTYEMNFVENDYDPHRLTKLCEEYSKAPTADFMQALRKAVVDIKAKSEELSKRNESLGKISKQLHFQMSFRKAPVTESELKSKETSISGADTAMKSEIELLQSEIKKLQASAQESKQKSADHQEKWKKELKLLENEISQTKSAGNRTIDEMKKVEIEQQAYLEKLKAKPPA